MLANRPARTFVNNLVLGAAIAVLSGGCAVNADESPDPSADAGEGLATVGQELNPTWGEGPFAVSANQVRTLKPVSTHHCVLTRVGGDLEGYGEAVRLEQENGMWLIRAYAMQAGVHGEAYCFNKNAILANGTARWSSGLFYGASGSCSATYTNAWQGDAATMVAGITGSWNGLGESVRINQAPDGWAFNNMQVNGCSGHVAGWASGIFSGTPATGSMPRFDGGEFTVSTNGMTATTSSPAISEVQMSTTDSSFCYFSQIAGNFEGGGESVAIYRKLDASGIERWYLQARAQQLGGFYGNAARSVLARARCYKRDQR